MRTHGHWLYVLLAAVLVWTSCSKPAPSCNDWNGFELRGNVRSVAITGYEAIDMDGQIVKDKLWYSRTVTFDRNGRIQEIEQEGKDVYSYRSRSHTIKHYDLDGELDSKEVTLYTAQGDILSWTQYDASDTILTQETYTYDSLGRCMEKQVYCPLGLNLICRDYTYDEAGHCTSYKAYNLDQTQSYGWQCTYDTLGRVTCEQWLNTDGSVSGCSTYLYNDQGFVEVEGTDNKYTNTYTYQYDAQDNWLLKYTMYSGGYDRPSYAIEERTIVYY